jgi:hypothetical protein
VGSDRKDLAEHSETAVSLDARLLSEVDAAFAKAAQRAGEALRAAGPESEIGVRFEAALRAVLDGAAADPDAARLCLVEAPGLGAPAVACKDVGLQRFVDLLDRELAASRGGSAPPLVAEMVVGGIYEVVQRTARAGDFAQMPALTGELRELWLPALRSQ